MNLWSIRTLNLSLSLRLRYSLLVVVAGDVRHVRLWQLGQDLAGEVGERKRRPGRVRLAGQRMHHRDAEDALPLRQRRDCREHQRALGLPEPLIVGEEERPIAIDGTAGDEAELIAAQRRLGAAGRLEEAGRVHRRVAEELPCAAAKLIGPRSVRGVDDGTAAAAVLGAVVVRLDLELGDRVGRDLNHLVREALVAGAVGVVVDAIELEVVRRVAKPVHVERALAAARPDAVLIRLEHPGRQQRQVRIGAAVERQVHDLLALDDLSALARIGLEQLPSTGDSHLICHGVPTWSVRSIRRRALTATTTSLASAPEKPESSAAT